MSYIMNFFQSLDIYLYGFRADQDVRFLDIKKFNEEKENVESAKKIFQKRKRSEILFLVQNREIVRGIHR